MKKQVLVTLLACAIVGTSAVCEVIAQTAPVATGTATMGAVTTGTAAPARGGRGGRAQVPPGPPAPVPPEVAITQPARDNACIRPAPSARGKRHTGLVQTANNGDFDIMFIGDSITDLLGATDDGRGNPGGKPEVQKYFGDVKVANFGVSGDTTQGVRWGFQNGEGQGHKPKAIMLMIGTNNTGGASGPEIAEGIGADILELRKDFPDAKIMLLAIFPRGTSPADANRRKVEEANKIIAKLDDQKHVFFVNINDKFLDEKGGLIGFRTTDNLHPVSKGFDIWLSSVAPTLKSWIK